VAPAYARWQPAYEDVAATTLVRVETASGVVGWGEAKAPVAAEICRDVIHTLLRPVLLGADPRAILPLWERLYGTMALRNHGAGFVLEAISAVDIALWDVAARLAGVPVCTLLGGAFRDRVPLYASGVVGLRDGADDEGRVADEARRFAAAGFHGVKVAIGHGVDLDVRSLEIVREAIGGRLLLADAAARYDLPQARRLARRVDELDLLLLEAPLPAELRSGYAALARHVTTPISNDLLGARWDWVDLLRDDAVSVVQPDVSRAGGLTECRRIASIAEAFGVGCMPHMSISSVVHQAACAHFAATLPELTVMECWTGSSALSDGGLGARVAIEDGDMLVPSGPGLGIEVDMDAVRSFAC
jgi:D-arabinonate dehydratase/D-galactarolactone cycloisomerase